MRSYAHWSLDLSLIIMAQMLIRISEQDISYQIHHLLPSILDVKEDVIDAFRLWSDPLPEITVLIIDALKRSIEIEMHY